MINKEIISNPISRRANVYTEIHIYTYREIGREIERKREIGGEEAFNQWNSLS